MAPHLPAGIRVRAIDWRKADEGDLAGCHALDMAIRQETRPGRKPVPVEWYVRDARQTPAHVQIAVWIVEEEATNDVVGIGYSEHEGENHDPKVQWVDVNVRTDWRRRGIGTHLLKLACDDAASQGRTSVGAGTSDSCAAGGAFAAATRFEAKLVERESELLLANVDWNLVERWIDEGPRRAPGYDLELTEGPLGEEYFDDLMAFGLIMETAPRDDFELEDWKPTREEIAIWEDNFLKTPDVHRWMYFARVRDTGECVGGTNVFFRDHHPEWISQGGTCVHPDHRGHALGKWTKAAMLDQIRRRKPEADRVVTDNAYSNDPMLGINTELGFKVTRSFTQWQAPLDTVGAALAQR
jgi:RimJ/RimL family protein N-acetyltransferase